MTDTEWREAVAMMAATNVRVLERLIAAEKIIDMARKSRNVEILAAIEAYDKSKPS